jgi:hypothetical protein
VNSVEFCTPSEAIEGLLLLVNAQEPILDVTYGSGNLWVGSKRGVLGCDIIPDRAKDFICDFTKLPFRDNEYPTVVYDPPFQPFVGSQAEKLYSGMGNNDKELKIKFQTGLSEVWRVTSKHLVVKCQGFIHNHQPQWMPLWAIDICGEPFEWLIVWRKGKIISGRWKNSFSLRRNHADYLVFNKAGNKR